MPSLPVWGDLSSSSQPNVVQGVAVDGGERYAMLEEERDQLRADQRQMQARAVKWVQDTHDELHRRASREAQETREGYLGILQGQRAQSQQAVESVLVAAGREREGLIKSFEASQLVL